MTIDQIDTSRFLIDPQQRGFVANMVSQSKAFALDMPISRKKSLTYITLMCDKESYFRKNIKNYSQRKFEAAICSGFTLKQGGVFDERVENVLIGDNEDFNRAIIQYLSMAYSLEYARLVVYEFRLYKLLAESFKTFDPKGKDLIDSLTEDIEGLEQKLFGGDEVLNARKALYEGTARSRTNLRIEQMVDEYAINKLKHLSPWGNYDLSNISVNFVGDKIPDS